MASGWPRDIFTASGLELRSMRGGGELIDAVSIGDMLLNKPEDLCAPQVTVTPVHLGPDRRKIGELIEVSQLHKAFKNVVRQNELRAIHIITCWNP